MRYAMIMAGGSGTRLWPMSRRSLPKQLIPLIEPREKGGARRSLLELSLARLEGLIHPSRIFICTSEAYRPLIRSAMPAFPESQILGEPVGRDTVNAVGLTAAVLEKLDKDAVFAVLTADHVIEPESEFRARMDLGFRLVEEDASRLVTFSIKPTYPATAYGYVERGAAIVGPGAADAGQAYRVLRFVEKPDLPRAEAYVRSGDFGWNSGMFVWQARTVMQCLERHVPAGYAGLKKIQEAWGTPRQAGVLHEVYPTLPKTSVDYAILEPVSRDKRGAVMVCAVPMDVRWMDVGSWPSFAATLGSDASGTRMAGEGTSIVHGGRENVVVNAQAGHTLALLGCEGLVVVHTKDATLVMPREQAEGLKDLQARLGEELK
jgi:mannose-1-phosphate guanylyltransferase